MKKIAVLLVLLLVACATQTATPAAQEPTAPAPHEEPAMTPSEPAMSTPPPAATMPSEPDTSTTPDAEHTMMTNKTEHTSSASSVSMSKPITVAPVPARKGGPLGDLSQFKTISEDTLSLVRAGKLDDAKTRAVDLENTWDAAESKLRQVSPSYWTKVDDAIYAAVKQLSQHTPDAKECENALTNLISVLDEVSAK